MDENRANYIGFAHFYFSRCSQETQSDNDIDKEVYTKLVELDTRLGTSSSEQLYYCLKNTIRSDIIKV